MRSPKQREQAVRYSNAQGLLTSGPQPPASSWWTECAGSRAEFDARAAAERVRMTKTTVCSHRGGKIE